MKTFVSTCVCCGRDVEWPEDSESATCSWCGHTVTAEGMSKGFSEGFAKAGGIEPSESGEAWAWFSRQLTNKARRQLELSGYPAGIEQGKAYKAL